MPMRTIEQWLHDAIVEEGYRRFDDLHIDEIDPRYDERSLWLKGINAALDEAAGIRDRRAWPFTIAAGIPLNATATADGPTVARPEDVVQQFGETPPSLYAFPRGGAPWENEREAYAELPASVVAANGARCYFAERFDKSDNEFQRTLWVSR